MSEDARNDPFVKAFPSALRAAIIAVAIATPAAAVTPRQIIADAAFHARDKPTALAQLAEAERMAAAQIARDPANRDARLLQAMAIGYRGKLGHSRRDALAARQRFEALVAADPRDAEAIGAVGTWHLDSVIELGGLVAGMAIGAKKATGLAMMDRAVALGGRRAFYPGLAALLRLAIDPADPRGRQLAEMASAALTPEPLDRQMQAGAAALLPALRVGDQDSVRRLARLALPFGRLKR